jgi:lysophospholipid acyltransferase (LPLAT)-like uncharacterized protein
VNATTTRTDDWRTSRAKRWQVAAIAAVGYPLVAALGRTFRWVVEGREHLAAVEAAGRPPIIAFWHGRILPGMVFFQRRGIVVMTSENFDGEWIARIIARFGYGTARGSTSRGGIRALIQMKRDMQRGSATAFTVDGPRGPAGRVQPGVVWLARASGSPIVPFHIEADRAWTAPSWDRTLVPKPFSRVAMVIAPPLLVPADLDDEGLEARRADLEAVLVGLVPAARALAGRADAD